MLPSGKLNSNSNLNSAIKWKLTKCHRATPIILFRACSYILPALLLYTMFQVYQLNNFLELVKRNTPLSDWKINTSLNLRDYIWPLEDTALIVPRGFCGQKTLLLIVVLSSVNGSAQRQLIRETWGNTTDFNYPVFAKLHGHLKGSYLPPLKSRLRHYADYLSGEGETLTASVQLVFMLGSSKSDLPPDESKQLQQEAHRYNDIIQESFIDTYNNLTLKSVLALKHVSKSCSNSTAFFFKCDDDTFVNVPNLLHFILGGTVPLYNDTIKYTSSWQSRLGGTTEVMRGYKFSKSKPIMNTTSKWYMPHYMYPHSTYPEYLSGGGYLLSIDVVQRLYDAAWSTKMVYLEDLYVTGLCAKRAHLKPLHSSLFYFKYSMQLCAYKAMITLHKAKGRRLKRVWKFVTDYGRKCAAPDLIVS
ncbi:beta-1-3-galactosyltransferase 1-like [Drosophila madeirensis]|uniref:Hexosyltransferase n=2 Tax=Drosophila madeirensis TaxID=30013 RepID=A0AAU9F7Q1_DROMD